jgi:ribosomal protein S20
MNAYQKIQASMKAVEQEVINHAKKFGTIVYERCSLRWMKAIDRLVAKGVMKYGKANRLRYRDGYYLISKRS